MMTLSRWIAYLLFSLSLTTVAAPSAHDGGTQATAATQALWVAS